jgi:transcriptional regulator with XRE-family HTH domain
MARNVSVAGQKFAAIRRERYLTQEEFAQRLAMSAANVRRIEQSDTSGMHFRNLRRLATLVKISPRQLLEQIGVADEASSDGPPLNGAPDFPRGIAEDSLLPVTEIAHFHGVSATRSEDRDAVRRAAIVVPEGTDRRFSVTIDGDCMEPKYLDGEIVVFSIDAAEREGIIDGRNYFVQFADGDNTFKRIFLDPENRESLLLKCWNAKYPPRAVERSSIKLLARAMHKFVMDEAC